MKITNSQGFVKIGRVRDSIGNSLTELLLKDELKVGQSLVIGHREYAKLHAENEEEVISGGKYQKNSPKYREVRAVNKRFGFDGKTKGFTAISVVINDEKTAKEVGLQVGDFAFQITKVA